MKIMINTNETEIRTIMSTVTDTIRVFEPNAVDAHEIDRVTHELTSTDSVYHFAQNCTCTRNHSNFTIDIDEKMVQDLAPVIIKVAKLVAPIYHGGKALLMTIKNLCETLPESLKVIGKEFHDKWALRKNYQVVRLENEDLNLLDIVVLEDDGKNDPEITDIFHISEVYENMTVQRHMVAKMTLDKSTIETHDEAIKVARKMRDNLRKDLEAMAEATDSDVATDEKIEF